MFNSLAVSLVSPSTLHHVRRGAARLAFVALGVVALLAAATRTVGAQAVPESKTAAAPAPPQHTGWGFFVTTGTLVPVGAQRDAVERANLTAAQVSYAVRPALAFGGTLGWARSRDLALADDAKLDVFTYDLGAEVRAPRWRAGRRITFSPFAGGGAGARSYNHRDLAIDATHTVSAYVDAGGELGAGRVRLRVDVRDYVSGFQPLGAGGTSDTRNDVVVMTGLRFVRR